MKITITEDDACLELSDDNLDNDNYVTIVLSDEVENKYEMDVSVDELLIAVSAFAEVRAHRLEREALMNGNVGIPD